MTRAIERLEDRLRRRGGRLGGAADVAAAVRRRAAEDRVSIVAAGLAFYTLLSLVPAVVAGAALYAWMRGIAGLARRIESWTAGFPDEIERLLAGQLIEVAAATGAGAGLGLGVAVLGTFWAASKAARAMMQALNIVFGVDDDRAGGRRRAIAVAVTFTGIILAVVLLSLFEITASVADRAWVTAVLDAGFWLSLPVVVAFTSALAYRFAPNRDRVPVPWWSAGVAVTTGVFLLATAGMALYVAVVGTSRAYGALGAVVAGGLWLLTISWGLLIGAYVDTELAARHRRG